MVVAEHTVSLSKEFLTIECVLNSGAETRGVDAFALSLIKAEKQMRRLVTHLVYQSAAFRSADIPELLKALESSKSVYFDGLERGFNGLYPKTVQDLIGSEYQRLSKRLCEARKYRNKIFHGQLTGDGLSRSQLKSFVSEIRRWCELLSNSCRREFGYEGFSKSFHKSTAIGLDRKLQTKLDSIEAYKDFIKKHMERKKTNADRC